MTLGQSVGDDVEKCEEGEAVGKFEGRSVGAADGRSVFLENQLAQRMVSGSAILLVSPKVVLWEDTKEKMKVILTETLMV